VSGETRKPSLPQLTDSINISTTHVERRTSSPGRNPHSLRNIPSFGCVYPAFDNFCLPPTIRGIVAKVLQSSAELPRKVKVKVKFTLEQATKAQRGSRGIALLFFNPGARRGGWSTPHPGRFTPGKDRYPLYRRLGGPQGWSERVRKMSLPPGFDPWTVQLVASRYTD
jgi:hypothetical protein